MADPAELSPVDKIARNLKACDVCRSRKVKCHYPPGEQTCRGCRSLGISCTQDKPRRRRGPANRAALQQKKRLSEISTANDSPAKETPRPRPQTLALSPHQSHHIASPSSVRERNIHTSPCSTTGDVGFPGLGSRSLILRVLTDWARFIYPLAPIQHKKRFLRRFLQKEDDANPTFRAVVLSTCAVTVTTLRRRSFHHYPTVTADTCIGIIEQDRLLIPAAYTLDWCISSYNVASSLFAVNGPTEERTFRSIKDAIAGVQWLLFNDDTAQRSVHDEEMLKRLHWLLAMWQLEAELRGRPYTTMLPSPPFTKGLDAIRPRCLHDSDPLLSEGMVDTDLELSRSWPGPETAWFDDSMEYITGLNSLADVLMVWEQAKVDMTHKPPADTLREGMTRVQTVLDTLIPELRWRGGLARFPRPCWGHEAQMVNILITSLYLRSNLMQHLGQAPGISHRSIVRDVLEVLEHLPDAIHENNGISLVYKVRDIGAAYLQELRITSDGLIPEVDEEAQRAVNKLLVRLENLDFRRDPGSAEAHHASPPEGVQSDGYDAEA